MKERSWGGAQGGERGRLGWGRKSQKKKIGSKGRRKKNDGKKTSKKRCGAMGLSMKKKVWERE